MRDKILSHRSHNVTCVTWRVWHVINLLNTATVWQELNPLCSPMPRLNTLCTPMPISLTPCAWFTFPLGCLPYSLLSPLILAIMRLFATNHFKKNIYIDILRMLAPYQWGYGDCCGVMDNGCFHCGSSTSISG